MSVFAGDLFGDVDLQACCPSVRVSNYPQGLIDVLAAAPAGPWMYTGALENQPQLIERMASVAPLWGNTADCLRRVRDPVAIFQALRRHGLTVPRVAEQPDNLPNDGTWLVKSRRSAGGHGVAPWRGGASAAPHVYFQQRIEGEPCAAVFVAWAGQAVFLGATRQLLAGNSPTTDDFRYVGSIGPLALEPALRDTFQSVGQALATEFPLSGLFGVDAVVADRAVWPVEVNPRYTASVEILERAGRRSLLACHAAACTGQSSLAVPVDAGRSGLETVWGKRILFARQDLEIGQWAADQFLASASGNSDPPVADIPAAGSLIARGRPILTVFARGDGPADAQSALAERVTSAERLLYG
ncbi:MAG TPA: ATP-grasp domain-containing protein [Pirellulales bacterium]|jgi:predicted ATP-grasp superfamily ATP-dependent carboligase|nr:ATP-grasp domain-containing protein [Pirellulales bacterium]